MSSENTKSIIRFQSFTFFINIDEDTELVKIRE